MRIWSIHPKYLDSKGLVALWREALLAKHVLEGKTSGYRHHPQLFRFINSPKPLALIHQYLNAVYEEAQNRQFNFDRNKFKKMKSRFQLPVSRGQLAYEFHHLLRKLKTRAPRLFRRLKKNKLIDPHPLFKVIPGPIENWEIVK